MGGLGVRCRVNVGSLGEPETRTSNVVLTECNAAVYWRVRTVSSMVTTCSRVKGKKSRCSTKLPLFNNASFGGFFLAGSNLRSAEVDGNST